MMMLMLCVLAVSCTKEYDDTELRGRIESLEEWQESVNSDIATLKALIANLEAKDYVDSVEPLADGSGYVINFVKSGAVTIKHGESGESGSTPVISAKQHTDGKYYWTVDGEFMTDAESGDMMPVTGEKGDAGKDAISPMIRIFFLHIKFLHPRLFSAQALL